MTEQHNIVCRTTDERALQAFLREQYRKHHLYVKVYPLAFNKVEHVDDMYVPVNIELICNNRHRRTEDVGEINSILRAVFDQRENERKTIFLNGSVGMGKTIFCKKLLSAWCHLTQPEAESSVEEKDLEIANEDLNQTFTDVMKQFSYVFYVSLRFVKQEQNIEKMIVNQLLEGKYSDIFEAVIQREPEKCLYLVDGLDEWVQPESIKTTSFQGIPYRRVKCSTIFTTRPWKMTDILRHPSIRNVELRLIGLDKVHSKMLSDKILNLAQGNKPKEMMSSLWKTEEEAQIYINIVKCPLHLKFATSVWKRSNIFHNTLTTLYCDILEWNLDEFCNRYPSFLKPVSTDSTEKASSKLLPEPLSTQKRCQVLSAFISKLGKLCFDSIGTDMAAINIEKELRDLDMSAEEIQLAHVLGVNNSFLQKTEIDENFMSSSPRVHSSFQEFLAALHLVQNPSKMKKLQNMMQTHACFDFYAAVLTFASGFEDSFLQKTSDILKQMNMIKCPSARKKRKRLQTQKVMFACLRELFSKDKEKKTVSLKHVFLRCRGDMAMLKFLKLDDVRSLAINSRKTGTFENQIVRMDKLQALEIVPAKRRPAFEPPKNKSERYQGSDITSLLEKQTALKNLTMWDCDLGHSCVLQLLCKLDTLTSAAFVNVMCKQDRKCGCLTQECSKEEAISLKQLIVIRSSGIVNHIVSVPNLRSLKLNQIENQEYELYKDLVASSTKLESLTTDVNLAYKKNIKKKEMSSQLRVDFESMKVCKPKKMVYKHKTCASTVYKQLDISPTVLTSCNPDLTNGRTVNLNQSTDEGFFDDDIDHTFYDSDEDAADKPSNAKEARRRSSNFEKVYIFNIETWPAFEFSCMYIEDLICHYKTALRTFRLSDEHLDKLKPKQNELVTMLVVGKAEEILQNAFKTDSQAQVHFQRSFSICEKATDGGSENVSGPVVVVALESDFDHVKKFLQSLRVSTDPVLLVALLRNADETVGNRSVSAMESPYADLCYTTSETLLEDIDDLLENYAFWVVKKVTNKLQGLLNTLDEVKDFCNADIEEKRVAHRAYKSKLADLDLTLLSKEVMIELQDWNVPTVEEGVDSILDVLSKIRKMYRQSKIPKEEWPISVRSEKIKEKVDEKIIDKLLTTDGVIGFGQMSEVFDVFIDETVPNERRETTVNEVKEVLNGQKIGRVRIRFVSKNEIKYSEVGGSVKVDKFLGTLGCFAKTSSEFCAIVSNHVVNFGNGSPIHLGKDPKGRDLNGEILAELRHLDVAAVKIRETDVSSFDVRFRNELGTKISRCRLFDFKTFREEEMPYLVHIWGSSTHPGKGEIDLNNFRMKDCGQVMLIKDRKNETEPFCKPGDSGAVICMRDRSRNYYAVAVLIGQHFSSKEDHEAGILYAASELQAGLRQLSCELNRDLSLCESANDA